MAYMCGFLKSLLLIQVLLRRSASSTSDYEALDADNFGAEQCSLNVLQVHSIARTAQDGSRSLASGSGGSEHSEARLKLLQMSTAKIKWEETVKQFAEWYPLNEDNEATVFSFEVQGDGIFDKIGYRVADANCGPIGSGDDLQNYVPVVDQVECAKAIQAAFPNLRCGKQKLREPETFVDVGSSGCHVGLVDKQRDKETMPYGCGFYWIENQITLFENLHAQGAGCWDAQRQKMICRVLCKKAPILDPDAQAALPEDTELPERRESFSGGPPADVVARRLVRQDSDVSDASDVSDLFAPGPARKRREPDKEADMMGFLGPDE